MSIFDHCYWLIGTALGSFVVSLLPFDTTGIAFAMTDLFTVIFIEQWKGAKSHIPALTGIIAGIGCLLVFGPDNFILPTLLISVAVLMALKSRILAKEQEE